MGNHYAPKTVAFFLLPSIGNNYSLRQIPKATYAGFIAIFEPNFHVFVWLFQGMFVNCRRSCDRREGKMQSFELHISQVIEMLGFMSLPFLKS